MNRGINELCLAEERVGTTSDVVILDAQDFAGDPMPIAGVVEHALTAWASLPPPRS